MAGEHWLDTLSRALARSVSRKGFLRLSGAAIAGTIFGGRVAPAEADSAPVRRARARPSTCENGLTCVEEPYASLACCNGVCCPTGMDCIHGEKRFCCPENRICDRGAFSLCCKSADDACTVLDGCCPTGQAVCGATFGAGVREKCCRKGEVCLAGEECCPEKQACGETCCRKGDVCVGQTCCPKKQACGQACCRAGQICRGGQCRCDAKACKNGCCDSASNCVTGTADHACGSGGQSCTNCLAQDASCDAGTRRCTCSDGSEPGSGICPPTQPNCSPRCASNYVCCPTLSGFQDQCLCAPPDTSCERIFRGIRHITCCPASSPRCCQFPQPDGDLLITCSDDCKGAPDGPAVICSG